MAGIMMRTIGPFTTVFRSDDLPGSAGTRLVAAVVWRCASAPWPGGWRGRMKRLRYRFGFGPLQRRISLTRDGGLWFGSAGRFGEQETLFHPRFPVVRVMGRDFPLPPPDETLLLLVDEAPPPGSVAVYHRPVVMWSPSGIGAQGRVPGGPDREGEMKAWTAFLEADPAAASFMRVGDEGPEDLRRGRIERA